MSEDKKRKVGKSSTKKVKKKSKKVKKSMAKKINRSKVKSKIEKRAQKVSDSDVKELMSREEEIAEKLKKVPGAMEKLVNRLKLLYEMISDYWKGKYKEVPWYSIAMAVAAVLYFVNPFDIIFDIVPGIGYVDDVLVIGLVFRSIKEDLSRYCIFKGYDPEKYF